LSTFEELGEFQFIERLEKLCHSEPVLTLAWESPQISGIPTKPGDCHTSVAERSGSFNIMVASGNHTAI